MDPPGSDHTQYPPVPDDGRILFFRRDRGTFGFLSHFHPAPVLLDGLSWPTVEHFYQAQKCLDPRYVAAIRDCDTPGKAKHLAAFPPSGREDRPSWFSKTGGVPRPDWNEVKRDIMRRADTAKYAQHPELAARLLATGTADIIEDARHDRFWGIGRDDTGENWAGRILMEVRAALRAGTP